jgi:hypothetical protein
MRLCTQVKPQTHHSKEEEEEEKQKSSGPTLGNLASRQNSRTSFYHTLPTVSDSSLQKLESWAADEEGIQTCMSMSDFGDQWIFGSNKHVHVIWIEGLLDQRKTVLPQSIA